VKIEILGAGCAKCEKLFANVQETLQDPSLDAQVRKVTDLGEIIRWGPLITPGLVVDGKLISSGKVLSIKQIKELLWSQ
jgi:small redox-active disulfide protein 2